MRLIDADKLSPMTVDNTGAFYPDLDIDLAPTVNAIPVRWIKKWGRRNNQKEIAKQILDDWKIFREG